MNRAMHQLLHGALRATENTLGLLEQTILVLHPELEPEPELEQLDPATRSLLYAADALAFAITRYRCEHRLDPR